MQHFYSRNCGSQDWNELKKLEFNQSPVQRRAYTPGKTASFPEFAMCCFAAL